MKNVIFIMSIVMLVSFTSACKTKTGTKEVSTTEETNSEQQAVSAEKELVGKHWKLIELFGNQVILEEGRPEAYIVFNAEDNRFSGNAGCNRMSGSYELTGADRISFSQVAVTRMMCINGMDTEDQFLQVINTADSYIIKNDTLILNRARMAPLARLVAVD